MTLKEKFREADKYSLTKPTHDRKCEDIADEYAIEFKDWCEFYDYDGMKTTNQLLEIFKKEKGL